MSADLTESPQWGPWNDEQVALIEALHALEQGDPSLLDAFFGASLAIADSSFEPGDVGEPVIVED